MGRLPTYPKQVGISAPPPRVSFEGTQPSGSATPSTYAEKVIKYVPAEVVAFWLPAYAFVVPEGSASVPDPEPETGLVWLLLGAGLAGTLIYSAIRARKEAAALGLAKWPPWYYWVLSVVAFLVWAIGTTSVANLLVGLSAKANTIILMIGVFLLPGIDEVLTRKAAGSPGK